MLIVFQSVNILSIIPISIIGLFTDVYFLKLTGCIAGKDFFIKLSRLLNLQNLPFSDIKKLKTIRYFDYGFKNIIQARSHALLSGNLTNELSNYFKNVSELESKLHLSLVSSFKFFDLGMVSIYANSKNSSQSIYFIHTNFLSYLLKSNGVKGTKKFHHILLPTEGIELFFIKLWSYFRNFFKIKKQILSTSLNSNDIKKFSLKKTAIFFDQTIFYGALYNKLHYFSSKKQNSLYLDNVACFVLNRNVLAKKKILKKEPILFDICPIFKIRDFSMTLFFLVSNMRKIKSLDQLSGLIFLANFLLEYRAWQNALSNYKNLKNIIIDYDVTFPKSLSLAAESLDIRTISMQERGSFSFGSYFGVITDTYLYAGGIYQNYGVKNKSISHRIANNFGPWRGSLFFSKALPDFYNLNFWQSHKNEIRNFSSVISFFGWSSPDDGFSHPLINTKFTRDFYLRIRLIAESFAKSAVLIRMKSLSDKEGIIMRNYFSDLNNVFICADYSKLNISYSICNHSDVIVSLQSSIAEESLFVGKKVILLNSIHNMKNICTDIYPRDFHFTIVDNLDETINLINKCMRGDKNLIRKYRELSKKLNGGLDLSTKDIIPDTIEKYLQ